MAALQDQDWLHSVQARTLAARARLSAIATANGLVPLPSATSTPWGVTQPGTGRNSTVRLRAASSTVAA